MSYEYVFASDYTMAQKGTSARPRVSGYGDMSSLGPLLGLGLVPTGPGLLDRSTALYFYKRLKTSLHKPRGNLLQNLFYKKCAFKNNLQLLEKNFLSQTNTTPKNVILLSKMTHF
jgi:hypothetical protein